MTIGLSINPVTFDITFMRGDAHTITFTHRKADGSIQDLTGWTGWKFTVKKSLDDTIGQAKFQKTLGGGITVPAPTSGQVLVAIAAADVAPLDGNHYYDLTALDAGGLPKTTRRALFIVPKDVTTDGVAGQANVGPISFPGGVYIDGFWYHRDQADNFWVKFRLFNRNFDVVSASTSTPPF